MGSRVFSSVAAGAALTAALFALPPAAAAGDRPWFSRTVPMRILTLGEPFAAGDLEGLLDLHGYRYVMAGDFVQRGARRVDYVIRSFPSDPGPQLYGTVTRDAIQRYDPSVILLMAGTNDLLRLAERQPGYTVPNIVEGLDALLAEILYLRPHADVIVAGPVDSPRLLACDIVDFDGIDDENGCGKSEGPSVATIVAAYAARNFHVALAAGMSAAVPRDKAHFPEGVHPSGPGGSRAVARVWMDAIARETGGPKNTLASGR